MNLIPSFSVDHTQIVPGIFTSRVDTVENGMVTTSVDTLVSGVKKLFTKNARRKNA